MRATTAASHSETPARAGDLHPVQHRFAAAVHHPPSGPRPRPTETTGLRAILAGTDTPNGRPNCSPPSARKVPLKRRLGAIPRGSCSSTRAKEPAFAPLSSPTFGRPVILSMTDPPGDDGRVQTCRSCRCTTFSRGRPVCRNADADVRLRGSVDSCMTGRQAGAVMPSSRTTEVCQPGTPQRCGSTSQARSDFTRGGCCQEAQGGGRGQRPRCDCRVD